MAVSTMSTSGENPGVDLLPGTLELIVLRTLTVMGPQHAYGITARIEQVANEAIRLNQGTLYPTLVRLEQKGCHALVASYLPADARACSILLWHCDKRDGYAHSPI